MIILIIEFVSIIDIVLIAKIVSIKNILVTFKSIVIILIARLVLAEVLFIISIIIETS